jgi:Na+-driven multidrug efflux pump
VFEVVFILTLLFVVFTALAIAGGVLGAKLLGKDRPAAVR